MFGKLDLLHIFQQIYQICKIWIVFMRAKWERCCRRNRCHKTVGILTNWQYSMYIYELFCWVLYYTSYQILLLIYWQSVHFSSTFRRKKVELLSSLRHLSRFSFLSESISQKLSKVSIWNLEYLFTIKRGTNYNKAEDPVICISRVIRPCFDIVHRN